MPPRQRSKIAFAVVTLVACTTPDRGAAREAVVSRAAADTTHVTTHEMVDALSRDVKAAERDLAATEDSLYLLIGSGDSTAVLLRKAHASWEQYRKLECDAIRVAFTEGTMAPVAQMECWIDLTDAHRKFMTQEYDYMRNGGPPATRPPR